jgi:hypothetical protein
MADLALTVLAWIKYFLYYKTVQPFESRTNTKAVKSRIRKPNRVRLSGGYCMYIIFLALLTKMVGLKFLTFSENVSDLRLFVDSIKPCKCDSQSTKSKIFLELRILPYFVCTPKFTFCNFPCLINSFWFWIRSLTRSIGAAL